MGRSYGGGAPKGTKTKWNLGVSITAWGSKTHLL